MTRNEILLTFLGVKGYLFGANTIHIVVLPQIITKRLSVEWQGANMEISLHYRGMLVGFNCLQCIQFHGKYSKVIRINQSIIFNINSTTK